MNTRIMYVYVPWGLVLVRFNVPLVPDIKLTTQDPEGLVSLLTVALEYITDEKFFELKKAAKILAYEYRSRMEVQ